MLTIKSLLGLTGGAALVAACALAARNAGDSVSGVLLVVGTAVALLLTRRAREL